MYFPTINRGQAMRGFVSALNAETFQIDVGWAVFWKFVVGDAGAGTGDGYSVWISTATAATQSHPCHLAGAVANDNIGAGSYGEIQTYGLHTTLAVNGAADTGTFLGGDGWYEATDNTQLEFQPQILLPVNSFSNTDGASAAIGYWGIATMPDTLVADATAKILWRGGYAVPTDNVVTAFAANGAGTAPGFLRCLG